MRETSELENWLGFQSIKAKDHADSFEEHAKGFDLPVKLGAAIVEVTKQGDVFSVKTEDNTAYSSKTVILATGKRHRPLNIPGEKELAGKGLAYCATCDAPFFKGKRVVVAGGGNSAFTTALDLLRVDAEVTLVNFLEGWQADRALQERIKKSAKSRFLDYREIIRIEGKERVAGVAVKSREDGTEESLEAEGIFVEIGLLPNNEAVREFVALNANGEVMVDCSSKTNVEGFFAAGDVTTVPHKQIVIAAGEGAKAALSAYDYLIKKSLI